MAKHLLKQAVIICAIGNSYQLCLFSVSISQINSRNGALMKQQNYDKNKEQYFSHLSRTKGMCKTIETCSSQ